MTQIISLDYSNFCFLDDTNKLDGRKRKRNNGAYFRLKPSNVKQSRVTLLLLQSLTNSFLSWLVNPLKLCSNIIVIQILIIAYQEDHYFIFVYEIYNR